MYNTCTVCNNTAITDILTLPTSGYDQSVLYTNIKILLCNTCGHVFNFLSEEDKKNIQNYYLTEYLAINKYSPNKTGDIPGSSNVGSIGRYEGLYHCMLPYLENMQKPQVLDVGCAYGGFLKYLKTKKDIIPVGIECSEEFIVKNDFNTFLGDAEDMSVIKEKMDIIVADQVVEHLFSPKRFFNEATRILADDGLLCVSVPNANKYEENYFFDYYWFLLREHINHFDTKHLILLAEQYGFFPICIKESSSEMMSNIAKLPNLTIIFSKNVKNKCSWSDTGNWVYSYIQKCEKNFIEKNKFIQENKIDYCWGASREFLFIYKNTDLKNITLVEDHVYRINNQTIDNKQIYPSEILTNKLGTVLITATAHTDVIKSKLKKLNFLGTILTLSENI